jgi:hypothetical protein
MDTTLDGAREQILQLLDVEKEAHLDIDGSRELVPPDTRQR